MAFRNRIRLPFYITRPQFPTEANVFRLADGTTKTASVIIKKTVDGETDNLPKEIHERLVIALRHDDVTIEGSSYNTGVSLEGDYEIDWVKFLDYPLAKAAFKVQITPFNYSNDNCQTCEEVTQIICNDDNIGSVNEGDVFDVDVLANDSACCKPITLSIITSNSTYVSSVTVIANNELHIVMNNPAPSGTGVILVTYRAQCANGQYDEANVIADITGTAIVCNAPINLNVNNETDTTATISWDQPAGAISYEWQLFLLSNLITPVQTGTANTADNNVILTGLTAATQYRLYVRSVCASGFSGYVYIDFTTDPASGTDACGSYELTNNSFGLKSVNYIDCNGNYQTLFIPTLQTRFICALQSSPGTPVDITVQSGIVINYTGLC